MMKKLTGNQENDAIIEKHLRKHWLYFEQTVPSKSINRSDLAFICAFPYNRVLYAKGHGAIKEVIQHADHHGERLMWIAGPSIDRVEVEPALINTGFEYHEKWVGMTIDLSRYQLQPERRDGFEFKRVQTMEQLKHWVDVYIAGYKKPASDKQVLIERFEQIIHKSQNEYQLYIGYYQGHPAVVGTLFFDEDVAGLYCITTAPSMRRKGLATAYLEYILSSAKQQGAGTCILHATEAGKPAYEKVGFQSSGIFHVYLLKSPSFY
ncbi:GNAT family N-acetyltransferase [Priestia megaterium]|nr:GNAT family N-acetyltransferase [Priestia megaterium]